MDKLEHYKLSPQTMLSPANEKRFMPLFHEYLEKAEDHLSAGWVYTNTLPFSQFRVRLACAWPILIGMKTIEKLRAANVIKLQQHVKISRRDIRLIILRTLFACPFSALWDNLFPAKAVALKQDFA
jgi:farnesyl-diphosphate farnesyltransferase